MPLIAGSVAWEGLSQRMILDVVLSFFPSASASASVVVSVDGTKPGGFNPSQEQPLVRHLRNRASLICCVFSERYFSGTQDGG